MGAWIEITKSADLDQKAEVAPLVGAWIEILIHYAPYKYIGSLLSWERGLKYLSSKGHAVSTTSLLSWERGLKLR